MTSTVAVLSYLIADSLGIADRLTEPLWAQQPSDLINLARAHRVLAIARHTPAVSRLPAGQREALIATHRRLAMQGMRSLSADHAALTVLHDAEPDVLIIKGAALSAVLYDDWARRGASADLDVLAPPAALPALDKALRRAGYVCLTDQGRFPPLTGWRGAYNQRLHYERCYQHPGLRSTVDLHWRLFAGNAHIGSFESAATAARTVQLPIGPVRTLGPTHTLVCAADQGTADSWPDLRSCADLLAAWRISDPTQRRQAARAYPSLPADVEIAWRKLRNGGAMAPGEGEWLKPTGPHRWADLFRARRRTDRWGVATARAALGTLLPARRLPVRRTAPAAPPMAGRPA